jgi:phosphatidylethanolamine/phosphatidyl-N-methylethanolamine N-methyltransferase
MNESLSSAIQRIRRAPSARWLFFRRALAHPLQLGTPLPSSQALGRLVARLLPDPKDGLTIEIGAGTGSVTRALLAAGMPADRLLVVEIDPVMTDYLRGTLPDVRVVTGDARHLPELVPAAWHGHVQAVISGIPMTVLSAAWQRDLVDAIFAVMAPDGRFLQYTYALVGSPIRAARLGLAGRRLGVTLGNFPPASVWTYRRLAAKEALPLT